LNLWDAVAEDDLIPARAEGVSAGLEGKGTTGIRPGDDEHPRHGAWRISAPVDRQGRTRPDLGEEHPRIHRLFIHLEG
jgi:hypothetical protein